MVFRFLRKRFIFCINKTNLRLKYTCLDACSKDLDRMKLLHRSFLDEASFEKEAAKRASANKAAERDSLKERLICSEIKLSQVVEVIKEIKAKILSWDMVNIELLKSFLSYFKIKGRFYFN